MQQFKLLKSAFLSFVRPTTSVRSCTLWQYDVNEFLNELLRCSVIRWSASCFWKRILTAIQRELDFSALIPLSEVIRRMSHSINVHIAASTGRKIKQPSTLRAFTGYLNYSSKKKRSGSFLLQLLQLRTHTCRNFLSQKKRGWVTARNWYRSKFPRTMQVSSFLMLMLRFT